jgi:hypothetical protein
MEPGTVLAVTQSVSTMPVGDELSVFDRDSGVALSLNRTAAEVFEHIDGHGRLGDVVDRLAGVYGVESGRIRDDVLHVVRALVSAGIVVAVTPEATADRLAP